MMEPLTVILVSFGVLYLVSELLQAFRIPRVVSQIGIGMIFGLPAMSEWLFTDESLAIIKFLAYIGSILLLFFVGLELDMKQLRKDAKTSVMVSLFNTSLPLVAGFLVSKYAFGLSVPVSIIVGICMSVSATALALDLLEETGKLKSALGTLIVAAGTVDDLVELVLVSSALAFIGTVATKVSLAGLFVNMMVFIVLLLLFRVLLIPAILGIMERKMYRPALFAGAFIIMLLLAVMAEYLGIGVLIGALFGGLIIRRVLMMDANHKPWERSEISHVVHSIGFGFFVPVFFMWVGMSTNVLEIWEHLWFGVVITVIAVVGTVIGSAFGYWLKSRNWHDAWLLGWAMNAKGDTELVVAQLALSAGIISQQIFSSLIFMAVVSTLMSPLVFRRLLDR